MSDDAKQLLGLLGGVLAHQVRDLDEMDRFIAHEVLLHQAHAPGCLCHATQKKQRCYLKAQIDAILPTVEKFNGMAAPAGLPTIDASRIINSQQAALAE